MLSKYNESTEVDGELGYKALGDLWSTSSDTNKVDETQIHV